MVAIMMHDVSHISGLSPNDIPSLPRTAAEVAIAAAALGFGIPDACITGVVANLALLDGHAATLFGSAAPSGQ